MSKHFFKGVTLSFFEFTEIYQMLSLSKNTERLWSSPVSSIMYGHGWTPLSSTVQGRYVDTLVMMFKANQYNELLNSKQALF